VFIVFFGDEKRHVDHPPGRRILIPLAILAALSITGGFVETPGWLGHVTLFTDLTNQALPPVDYAVHDVHLEHLLQAAVAAITLGGVLLSFFLYLKRPSIPATIKASPMGARLSAFWLGGWGFDTLYDRLVVRPFVGLARLLRGDPFDGISAAVARATDAGHTTLSRTQTGRIRTYAFGIGLGAVIALAIVVFS
jgi:NADH-quinone oxidoreductase subunit L